MRSPMTFTGALQIADGLLVGFSESEELDQITLLWILLSSFMKEKFNYNFQIKSTNHISKGR